MDRLAFLISEGIRNLVRHKLTATTTVISLVLNLTVLSVLFLIGVNSHQLIEYLRSKYKIEVFFDSDLEEGRLPDIKAQIDAIPGVRSSTIITKEDAKRIFHDQFGEDVESMLGYNPLPASCVVNVVRETQKPVYPEAIIRQIKTIDGVDDISYQGRLISRIERAYLMGVKGEIAIAMVILLIIIIIMSGTIRLSAYARQDLMHSLQLIGASKWFIKIPFMIESLLISLTAALIAFGITVGVVQWGNSYLSRYRIEVNLDPNLLPALLIVGIIVGVISAQRAVSRFLRS
ncbi:MAG: FtsX-like permease family protein [Candidatus Neomarinimicrobiota bacterium]|nr:MAG: FtsX-like permease family protein [Candidatus Neomarinimicrobiota bacterium]